MNVHPCIHDNNPSDPKFLDFDEKIKDAFPGWNVDTNLNEFFSSSGTYKWILSIYLRRPFNFMEPFIIERHTQWDNESIDEALTAHSIDEIVQALS